MVSSSTTSKVTGVDKVLGFSDEYSVFEIPLWSGGTSRVLIEPNPKPNSGCSFSPLINNRYVYEVGGRNQYTREITSDVFYYDLSDPNHKRCQGPQTISPKFAPTLIVLGSKLFAFSDYRSVSDHMCEVLDAASESDSPEWKPLKICPNLPFGGDNLSRYFVVSYATHMNNLFLSLGDGDTSFAVCYNDSNNTWSRLSKKPLPFHNQGIFVDDIGYGFPQLYHNLDSDSYYLASYKLSVDWESSFPIVSCQELVKYSLPTSPTPQLYGSFLLSFFVSSSKVCTIIETTPFSKQYALEVYAFQLVDPTNKNKRDRHASPPPRPSPPQPLPGYAEDDYIWKVPQIDDHTQGSSEPLNHNSIPLPHHVTEILGPVLATYEQVS